MKLHLVSAAVLAASLAFPLAAHAQGVPDGVSHGAYVGAQAAGPVGGLVGGVVGGVIGGVNGALGIRRGRLFAWRPGLSSSLPAQTLPPRSPYSPHPYGLNSPRCQLSRNPA